METGDRRTEDRGGLPRNEENVIRLPRDWLGPPEELVPIGSAARARAAQRDLDNGMAPSADAFWSEDSAALHDALQAPPNLIRERHEPPVGLVPPVVGQRTFSLDSLRGARLSTAARRVSRGWGLLALPVAALLLAAVIGLTEGPASQPSPSRASASRALNTAQLRATRDEASPGATTETFWAQVKRHQHDTTNPSQRQAADRPPARTQARQARAAKTHHRMVRHPSRSPAPTVTKVATSSQTSHPTAVATHSTGSTALVESTRGSAGSKPAPSPPGPSGFGSFSGGCNPKCS